MWFKPAFASLQSQCGSLEAIVKERSMYSLSIKVNKTEAIERYDIDLQNVDGDIATPYDPSSLARVLDVVFPADQKAGLNIRSLASQHNPDDNVEVRRAYPSGWSRALIQPHLVVCCSPLCGLLDASLRSSFK